MGSPFGCIQCGRHSLEQLLPDPEQLFQHGLKNPLPSCHHLPSSVPHWYRFQHQMSSVQLIWSSSLWWSLLLWRYSSKSWWNETTQDRRFPLRVSSWWQDLLLQKNLSKCPWRHQGDQRLWIRDRGWQEDRLQLLHHRSRRIQHRGLRL